MADSTPTGRLAVPHTARDPAQGRTGRHAGAPGLERNAPPRRGGERGVGRRAGPAAVLCATAFPVTPCPRGRRRRGRRPERTGAAAPAAAAWSRRRGEPALRQRRERTSPRSTGARRPPVRHGPRRPGRTGERGTRTLRSPRAPGDGAPDRHPPGLRRRRPDAAVRDSARRSDVPGAAGNQVLPARLHCPASLRQAPTAGGTGPCDDPCPPPTTAPRRPCSPLASPSPRRRTPATPPEPSAPLRSWRIRTSGRRGTRFGRSPEGRPGPVPRAPTGGAATGRAPGGGLRSPDRLLQVPRT
jgi:hypothetical protein